MFYVKRLTKLTIGIYKRKVQRVCAILIIFTIMSTFSGNLPFLNTFNITANAINLSDVQQRINSFRSVYPTGSTGPAYYRDGKLMSSECWGFADTMFDYLFGANTSKNDNNKKYGNAALDTLCVGDHIRRASPLAPEGHSIVVTNISGDTI